MFSQRTLVIVHKKDLLTGWKKDIDICFDKKIETGIIQCKTRLISEHITLAMVQTLNKWSDKDIESISNYFGLVVVDEVHHAPANSYSLVQKFNSRYRLGLSATPERSDGLTDVMHFYFGNFAYKHKHISDEQDVLPVEVIYKYNPFKYSPCINNSNGNIENLYEEKDNETQILRHQHQGLGLISIEHIEYSDRPNIRYHYIDNEVLSSITYLNSVCDDICEEFYNGSNIIAFFSQKKHVKMYHAFLCNELGEENIQTFYGDSNESDDIILERAESGKVRVTLTTYSKGTEGTNVKAWDTAFLVSSINNEKNTEQAIGRIRRIKEGKRPIAKVFDYRHPYVYTWKYHGETRDNRYRKLKFKLPQEIQYKGRYARG